MLKILQICNKAPFPANDGSSIAIYNMAQGFIENNLELHLLTINTKKHFKPDSDVPAEFKQKTHYRSVYRNTNTSMLGAFLNLFSVQSYFVSRFYFKEFEKTLIDTLQKNKFDIVQVEGLPMAVYLDVIKEHSNAKIALRAHNIEHFIWNRLIARETLNLKKIYLGLQNRKLKRFELSVFSTVDAIVSISKSDEDEIKRLGCKKPLFTCITGVDVKAYQTKLNVPTHEKSIFYFGSMDWLPNQEAVMWFLEHCWKAIHKTEPDAKLTIAGRGMPPSFYQLKLPNVEFVENVKSSKVFYQQHQIMIVPLWSGSGLRIKIIEGMSYGKAIVSTSIGAEGIGYSVGENILIGDTAESFTKNVIMLLQDSRRRKNIEKAAADFALQEFDNHRVVQALVQFYKNISHV